MERKFVLTNAEADINTNSDILAGVIVERLGLIPRKKGSTEKMNKVLIELYERSKNANRMKDATKSIMTVEEMGYHAGITRQTMYDYLKRWLELDMIAKQSFIDQHNNVIIGYKLNGNTIEQAFEKAQMRIGNNLELTMKYIRELQKMIKNEKISEASQKAPEQT